MEHRTAKVHTGLYQATFESATVALMIFDMTSRRCLAANRAADRTYGYRAREWHAVALSDLGESCGGLEPRAEGGAAQLVRHRRRDGSGFWAAVSLVPLDRAAAGYAVLQAQDVTQQQDQLADAALMRDHFSLAQELTGLGHCVVDLKRGRQSWSALQLRNFGLGDTFLPGDAAGVDATVAALLSHVHALDRERAAAALGACVSAGVPFNAEWRVLSPGQGERIVHVEGMRKDDSCGNPDAFVCTSLDVTDKRRTEESLRQTRIDLSRAQTVARLGTWMIDFGTGMASTTSEETRKVFGFDQFEVPLALLNERIHPDDMPAVERARHDCLAHPATGYFVRYRTFPRPGELHYVESQAEVQTDAAGKAVRMVGYLRDVTEARLAELEIQRLAYHDEVTGLPNRVALRRQLERATSFDVPDFVPLALLVIDVSRFQDICLTLGHNNSDQLLKDVAERIAAVLGEHIFLAHIGGSQFAAILSGTDTYESKPRARIVLKAFEAPFQVAGIQYDINVHIGVALFPGHASDPFTLMRRANVAVFQARQIGTDLLVYRPGDDPYQPQRLALLGEFRQAIQDGQIELYCQPKLTMRTGEVIGAEALVRWRHPQRGMIPPALFVPLIEDTELIHVLTRHMLQAAVRQCFNWQRAGLHLPLAVNVSPRNLLSHELVPRLEALLHTWGGDPTWLGLEITESCLITDPDASIAELTKLSRMGFQLSIDDFGTGYSSLSYLTRMPVNVIKVDNSFTMRMLEDKRAAAIVKSTIELAHNLGMSVVAEGTSSREIWDALAGYDCDEVQGFYVAQPFPAAEFSGWLKSTGHRVRAPAAGHAGTTR